MRLSSMHYFPLAWPFLLALALLFIAVVALIEFGILKYAYERMGIPPRHVFGVLLLSLLGSAVNIPVAQLPPEQMVSGRLVDFFGVQYVVPVVQQWPGTVIAVNVGGALIPVILSLYLLMKNRLYVRGVLAVAVVAVVTHQLAYPVRGVGISVPVFIPPLVAAFTALILGWRRAAPLAYIAGSMGTLIGADLLNLGRIQGLGAPIASIGGAGTFDGVFLSGIIAVLLSPFAAPRSPAVIAR
ncbi:MAG TPA: DUF1614 domain-containing protein [Bryobacteraceae bacterium]|nr:DUF1614 domain-containing protein [Bryobacteraceae bacterium]